MTAMSAELLWNRVRRSFETDDGSLPTVELRNLARDEVGEVYGSIRRDSRLTNEDVTFWDTRAAADRGLDSVPNAALLVSTDEASPFHFAVEGISSCGVLIPCLGVHVFQESIALDYRMGDQWGASQVLAFFSWLEDLLSKTHAAILVPNAEEGPPDPEAFMCAWKTFRERHNSTPIE